MDTLDLFINDYNYFNDSIGKDIVINTMSEIKRSFDNLIEYYASHDKFFTEEEKEEMYEVIKQKVLLEIDEQLKPFILLKK